MIGIAIIIISMIAGASSMTYYETKIIRSVFTDRFDYYDRMHKLSAIISTVMVCLGSLLTLKGI